MNCDLNEKMRIFLEMLFLVQREIFGGTYHVQVSLIICVLTMFRDSGLGKHNLSPKSKTNNKVGKYCITQQDTTCRKTSNFAYCINSRIFNILQRVANLSEFTLSRISADRTFCHFDYYFTILL